MTAYAIRAEGLGKRYELGRAIDPHRTAREALVETASGFLRGIGSVLGRRGDTQNAQEFWALRDVSFEVQQGEAVGLIGSNGAGKSTLLKLLSRITAPTTGRAEIRGRVGSLLEVGTGFHPDLTGRENVFLNGAILGMRRSEIERKFDEIVAFAELERFIDTPVKRYSSGMYMRLAFAVAAHLEPEVLLVDEVLAVGDAAFQKKCLGKMGEVTGEGRTVVFVSHNMSAVQALCPTALLLAKGLVLRAGATRQVVAEYLRHSEQATSVPLLNRLDRRGAGNVRFQGLTFHASGEERGVVSTGEDVRMRISLAANDTIGQSGQPDLAVILHDSYGHVLTTLSPTFAGGNPALVEKVCELVCDIPRFPLLAGEYRVDLWYAISGELQDHVVNAARLRVEPGQFFLNSDDLRSPRAAQHGPFLIPQHWSSSIVESNESEGVN